MLFQDPGSLGGEVALVLLFSVRGAGLAVGLVDLAMRQQQTSERLGRRPSRGRAS
jgi:hypothetical protein